MSTKSKKNNDELEEEDYIEDATGDDTPAKASKAKSKKVKVKAGKAGKDKTKVKSKAAKASKKVAKGKSAKASAKDKKAPKAKGKRGAPRGAQWKKWDEPFQPSSGIGQLFVMAAKGIKQNDFTKAAKKLGLNPGWALGRLRKEQRRGWRWKFDDANGRIRVSHAKMAKAA